MHDEELRELEKQFLVESDLEHKDVKESIKALVDFCQVDKGGFVVLTDKGKALRMADRIFLVFAARYLGVKLQQKLGTEPTFGDILSADELARISTEKKDVVAARMKDLKDNNKIQAAGVGAYRAAPHAIKSFLKTINQKSSEQVKS